MNNQQRFYGKYKGTVVNNIDPERRCRIQALVPDVLGIIPSSWAEPCLPWAGQQMGTYLVPPPGSGVWIEFQQGNPDYPIWVGCYWGATTEVPPIGSAQTTPGTPVVVVQALTQGALVISDVPVPPMKAPGVMLINGSASITVDATGITITAPTITLTATTAVNITGATTNINSGALVVT